MPTDIGTRFEVALATVILDRLQTACPDQDLGKVTPGDSAKLVPILREIASHLRSLSEDEAAALLTAMLLVTWDRSRKKALGG